MEELHSEDFHQKKNALALRLQQRRPRQVLADQGIIPPLKSPGTYFSEVQKLERARNKDYLNHAIPARPDRDALVQRHILEDTSASGSIVANQKDLKKAKLVDDLNDKIAFRPGVIELVERNILPATEVLQEAIKGGHIQYKKISDFIDEDSSDALSPEQVVAVSSTSLFQLSGTTYSISTASSSTVYTTENENVASRTSSSSSLFSQSNSHPYLSRQSSKGSKLSQSGVVPKVVSVRKKKDKPRFKKLRYHVYVPPDQQGKSDDKSSSTLDEDTPYSRLLHQQQVYLKMQIMNNQYSNSRSGDSQQNSLNQLGDHSPSPSLFTQTMKVQKSRNPNAPLTLSRLEEMKVSELKEELKQKGQKVMGYLLLVMLEENIYALRYTSELPQAEGVALRFLFQGSNNVAIVTGTKEVLVERLKPFCVSNDTLLTEDSNSNFSMMSEVGSTNNAQTAFPINPNMVLSHRVARMPAPECHKVVLKHERLTMPQWNHTGESMGTQTAFPPNQTVGRETDEKNKIIEQQRHQINALKQLVERTQTQLHQHHHYGQNVAEDPVQLINQGQQESINPVAFQFPTTTHTSIIQTPATVTDQGMVPMQHQQQQANSGGYGQPYEMMNGPLSAQTSTSEMTSMEDILELIDQPEPHASPVARVLLNDHNSYHGLNDSSSNLAQTNAYPQQQHVDYRHKPVRMRRRRRPMSANRLSQEYADQSSPQQIHGSRGGPDFTKMLVESSGDALMDTSSFPPTMHRYSCPVLDQQSSEHSRLSARNSADSGLAYMGSTFSPMETGSQQDILNDLRLSTSSLDSSEAVLMPPATPPRMTQPQIQPLLPGPNPSPHFSNHNLVKSASQELLSSNSPVHVQKSASNELSWLDLPLASVATGSPSSMGLFDTPTMAPQQGTPQYQLSNPVSNRGSQDADLNLFSGDLDGFLDFQSQDQQWDGFDGILNSNFNT